ncbi:hypothetical protein BGZ99_007205 [Dissophora globulifera]|uniref:Phosphatidylglycerol/phosphatidylinositol transfer protein n=1 Tax=Dissophora globulifera TaxID=979702 RepID=A0A9P6RWD7_9FUNG|nr:hypothetical protein BGZ99_007205 [Dissophora globulifera]
MKFFAAIAALALAVVASAQQPTWTNCAVGTADLVISSFTVAPYPLCINQNVCASGTGILSTPVVAGGTLAITGRFAGRVVYSDNHDLCTLTGAQGYPCPIATTLTSITICVLVKNTAPAGINVALTVQATNGNNHVLFCQAATVTASNC